MLEGVKIAADRFGVFSFAFAQHIFHKTVMLTLGALFVSDSAQSLRRFVAQWRKAPDFGHMKIAIIAHAYYPGLIHEILACRSFLPGNIPVHLTVPEARKREVEKMLSGVKNITVHSVENRGRDIAPLLLVLQSGALDKYDAVLKLHTKQSPHLWSGGIRRKLLFLMLCGEKIMTLRALSAFCHPSTGMLGWHSCFRTAPAYMMANEDRVREVAMRMGVGDPLQLGFFEGSMFWFRPSAFAALREIGFQSDDFELEEGQLDGTLHHAIERCFTLSTWASGMHVRDLRGRILTGCKIIGSTTKIS